VNGQPAQVHVRAHRRRNATCNRVPTGPGGLSLARVADKDLQDLVRRRLLELGITAEEASRRCGWVVPPETIERLARSGGRGFISESFADRLAMALDVPENRVRRASGLPLLRDERESISTGPHLRLLRGNG
jgi:hypothetical protein